MSDSAATPTPREPWARPGARRPRGSPGDFVAIGHVSRDEFPDGSWRCGGSAFYGAVTMARLGVRVALVARIGEAEYLRYAELAREVGIDLRRLPSITTTTFVFSEEDGRRVLRLRARARAIAARDVPTELGGRPALLGSVVGEHADDLFAEFSGRAVLTAQGELRAFDAQGRVRYAPWRRAGTVAPRLRALVCSDEDLEGDLAPAFEWSSECVVVVTRGARGAALIREGARVDLAAYRPARVVDPTGAGDAFAAGLLVAREEGASWEAAADFANCVASFCLEGIGVAGLAERSRVDERRARGDRLPLD